MIQTASYPKTNIIYGALDVDDKSFNFAHYDLLTNDQIHFKCLANTSKLIQKLKIHFNDISKLKICYESTYLGFSLCRDLNSKGISCEVIASGKIPKQAQDRIKTDRLDSLKLAEYYAKGLLTPIHIPDIEDENIREIIRSRSLLIKQLKQLKTHIISLCKRNGMDFRKEKKAQNICYWGQVHNKWLESKINTLSEISPLKFNLLSLNSILESLQIQIERYNDKIKQISQTKKYAKTCRALECFRGLDTLTAMTLVSEIGDIKRFPHPRNLMSYTGFSIAEYSSGGKEKRFKITKIGNPFIRTVTVEACQFAFKTPHISRHLAKRRLLVNDPTLINIADKCMMRLHKKSTRLLFHGKHRNKIKVACAREMLGFIWDVMQKTAA